MAQATARAALQHRVLETIETALRGKGGVMDLAGKVHGQLSIDDPNGDRLWLGQLLDALRGVSLSDRECVTGLVLAHCSLQACDLSFLALIVPLLPSLGAIDLSHCALGSHSVADELRSLLESAPPSLTTVCLLDVARGLVEDPEPDVYPRWLHHEAFQSTEERPAVQRLASKLVFLERTDLGPTAQWRVLVPPALHETVQRTHEAYYATHPVDPRAASAPASIPTMTVTSAAASPAAVCGDSPCGSGHDCDCDGSRRQRCQPLGLARVPLHGQRMQQRWLAAVVAVGWRGGGGGRGWGELGCCQHRRRGDCSHHGSPPLLCQHHHRRRPDCGCDCAACCWAAAGSSPSPHAVNLNGAKCQVSVCLCACSPPLQR